VIRNNVRMTTNDLLAARARRDHERAMQEYERQARQEEKAAMWVILYMLLGLAVLIVVGFAIGILGTEAR
jgi:hypothetical protein